jgi:hypothetical protein
MSEKDDFPHSQGSKASGQKQKKGRHKWASLERENLWKKMEEQRELHGTYNIGEIQREFFPNMTYQQVYTQAATLDKQFKSFGGNDLSKDESRKLFLQSLTDVAKGKTPTAQLKAQMRQQLVRDIEGISSDEDSLSTPLASQRSLRSQRSIDFSQKQTLPAPSPKRKTPKYTQSAAIDLSDTEDEFFTTSVSMITLQEQKKQEEAFIGALIVPAIFKTANHILMHFHRTPRVKLEFQAFISSIVVTVYQQPVVRVALDALFAKVKENFVFPSETSVNPRKTEIPLPIEIWENSIEVTHDPDGKSIGVSLLIRSPNKNIAHSDF